MLKFLCISVLWWIRPLKVHPSPVKGWLVVWGSQDISSLAATKFRRPTAFCWGLWLVCPWECIWSADFLSWRNKTVVGLKIGVQGRILTTWVKWRPSSRKEGEIGQLWEAKSQRIRIMLLLLLLLLLLLFYIYFPPRRGRNIMCWKGYTLHSLEEESGSWKAAN